MSSAATVSLNESISNPLLEIGDENARKNVFLLKGWILYHCSLANDSISTILSNVLYNPKYKTSGLLPTMEVDLF